MMERCRAHPRYRIIFVVSRRKGSRHRGAHQCRHANESSGHEWPERIAAEHRLLPSLSQAYSRLACGDLKLWSDAAFYVLYFDAFLTVGQLSPESSEGRGH